MVVMMSMAGVRLVEVAFRPAARLILHLHGCMSNLIMMLKEMMDALQQRVMIVRGDHLHM